VVGPLSQRLTGLGFDGVGASWKLERAGKSWKELERAERELRESWIELSGVECDGGGWTGPEGLIE